MADKWITVKGARVKVDGEGNAVLGAAGNLSKTQAATASPKSEAKKSENKASLSKLPSGAPKHMKGKMTQLRDLVSARKRHGIAMNSEQVGAINKASNLLARHAESGKKATHSMSASERQEIMNSNMDVDEAVNFAIAYSSSDTGKYSKEEVAKYKKMLGMDEDISIGRAVVAFDKASARRRDDNGHLIVDSTIITKAAVNPYYGREIPNYEQLGLDPEKIYMMLRDPEELKKGMHTLGEKQLLLKHIFVSADDPQKESIAGTIGSNLEMVGDDVKGSLTVWDNEAINLIESGKMAELSASYFYDPVMKSGTFKGEHYDGIMTNIRGNHVALVERGRIGRDALVADALPKLMEFNMKLKKGAFARIDAAIRKSGLVAMDAELTTEEIKELVEAVAENIEHTVEDTEEVEKLEGAEDEKETADDEDEQTRDDKDNESEAMRLKEREKREEKDREEDKKAAMDAAIKTAEDQAVQRVTALFEARELVKPLVGVVAMDSAESVYKHALEKSGVSTKGVHHSAFKSMVDLVLKQKSAPQARTAMDSASFEDDPLTSRFK